jgi:hypothetical protein
MANSQSKITLQKILDKILPLGDVNPVLVNVSGYQLEPFITICTDVYNEIVGLPFPHKWNEVKLPYFYTNSWQQDYALINPNGTSVYNVEWLSRGIVVDMRCTSVPKAWGYVECGRELSQATGSALQPSSWRQPTFLCNWFPNYMLYYGTWGATDSGSSTTGNNPGPNSIFTNPLTASANSQPNNPINQIIDPNGNLQVVSVYGTCGATQPNWPAANAAPGTNTTDGSVVWKVVDPNGVGIRILPVPSQTGAVFQFNLVAQAPAIQFTSLSQTLSPLPDKYEPYFRQGVIAQCYRYSSVDSVQKKFERNYQMWLKSLNDLRSAEDRELDENMFIPDQSVFSRGGGSRGAGWRGAAYPFAGPGQGN